jgi:hypothetical protein
MSKYDFLLQKFNTGQLEDVLGALDGKIEPIIGLLDKKGLLDQIDLTSNDNEEYHNDSYYYFANYHPEKFLSMMLEFFDEISVEGDGRIFLTIPNRGDLSELFCDASRNSLSQSAIEDILNGENDWGRFDDISSDNLYRDMIEDLTPENQTRLYQRVLKDFQNESENIYPETELLQSIAEEQGHDDFVELTQENIPKIFSDEDSALSVLGILEDLRSDLHSLYDSAYNNAYEDELYENIFNSLSDFFVGKGDWVSKPSPKDPTKTQYNFKIEVNDFVGLMKRYFDEMRGEGAHTIENYGYFMTVLLNGIYMGVFECIRVYTPNYADWTKMKESFNELFSDYI